MLAQGHTARIIDSRLVAPYRRQSVTGKNDANDAEAICEAAGRPHMRFVPIKTPDQQALLIIHRLRDSAVKEHTRTSNQMRGLLAEFGQGADKFKKCWADLRQAYAEDNTAIGGITPAQNSLWLHSSTSE